MDFRTTIEKAPPLGGNCGWGEPTDPSHHRLYKERILAEQNEDAGLYVTPKQLAMSIGDESPMVQLVKDAMPYDDGWDCDYVDRLLYGGPAYCDQDGVGSCVGAGVGSAIASKASTEILMEGDPENPFGMIVQQYQAGRNSAVPCIDFHYGAGKMKNDWDGSKFTRERNMQDGSYCSVQIWALKTCGILPCSAVLDNGLVFPQTKNIRAHAGNRGQFLNRHLAIARQHTMGDSIRVREADDLHLSLVAAKQPAMICSSWAFVPDRFVEGLGWVYKRQGTWHHNMTISACFLFKGNWYVKVRNQWGPNAHRDGWSFLIPIELFDQWVRSADCQSIGELRLIPSKAVPEFVW